MSDFDSDGAWGDDDNGGDWGEDSIDEWGEENDEPLGDVAPNPQANPLLPTEADARIHSPPAANVQGSVQESKPALVAKFDSQGRPFVCCRVKVVNGKPVQISEWRRPTADEYNAIMYNSKKLVVEGGVAAENVPTATNAQATSALVPLGSAHAAQVAQPMWKKAVKVGAGVAVVGTVGYFGWRLLARNFSEK